MDKHDELERGWLPSSLTEEPPNRQGRHTQPIPQQDDLEDNGGGRGGLQVPWIRRRYSKP